MLGRIERPFLNRNVPIDTDEAFDLVAERRKIGGFSNGAVAGPFVLLGQTQVVCLVADCHAVFAEENAERPSNWPVIFERNGVMSAVPSGMPVVSTISPPAFLIS